jgi:tetratricopeptide (TPR) repeat protein
MEAIKYFKILVLSIILLQFAFPVIAQDSMLKEAETAYIEENYSRAAELYEEILQVYGESSEVFYNLGNAYYKIGRIAPAIVYYERALLLDPGDADIRFNLEMAKMRTVDRIEPIGDFFLVKWFKDLQNMASSDSWAKIGIICFLAFIGCLVLFFFSRWVYLKKIGFSLGILFLVLVIVSNIFAANQKQELTNRTAAIVFAPTVTVKSTPSNSGTDLFVLHEGTKVFIKSSLGEWNEIELEDGNIGWMPQKDMEII